MFDPEEIKIKVNALDENTFPLEIAVNIYFYTDTLKQEVADYISKRETIDNPEIGFIEHAFKFVYAQFDSGEEKLAYSFPPLSAINKDIKLTPSSKVERTEVANIKFNSLAQAKKFSQYPRLYLKLLVSIPESQSSQISFNEDAFLNSQRFRELEGAADETKRTKITNISSSSGFSLDIKPLKLGGGSGNSSTETDVEHSRLVSTEYINNTIDKYITDSNLRIKCRNIDPEVCDKHINNFKQELNSLVQNASSRQTFDLVKKESDKEYQLIHSATNTPIIGASITQGAIVKAQQELANDSKEKTSGNWMKIFSGSKETEQKKLNKHDIEWELKAGEWVPVSLTMSLMSESKIRESLTYSRSQEVIGKVRSNQFIIIKGTPASNISVPVAPYNDFDSIQTFSQLKKYAESRLENIPTIVDTAIEDKSGPKKISKKGPNVFYYESVRYAYASLQKWNDAQCESIPVINGFTPITTTKYRWVDEEAMNEKQREFNSSTAYTYAYGNGPYIPKRIIGCLKTYNRNSKSENCNGAGEGCLIPKGVTIVECYVNNEWLEWNNKKIQTTTDNNEIQLRKTNRFLCSP